MNLSSWGIWDRLPSLSILLFACCAIAAWNALKVTNPLLHEHSTAPSSRVNATVLPRPQVKWASASLNFQSARRQNEHGIAYSCRMLSAVTAARTISSNHTARVSPQSNSRAEPSMREGSFIICNLPMITAKLDHSASPSIGR
jgi:hypothetical protein